MISAKSSKFNAGGCHAGQRADPVEERVNGRVADDEIDCGNDSNGIVALTPARMGEHGDAFAVVHAVRSILDGTEQPPARHCEVRVPEDLQVDDTRRGLLAAANVDVTKRDAASALVLFRRAARLAQGCNGVTGVPGRRRGARLFFLPYARPPKRRRRRVCSFFSVMGRAVQAATLRNVHCASAWWRRRGSGCRVPSCLTMPASPIVRW